jgi:hypothetical protein
VGSGKRSSIGFWASLNGKSSNAQYTINRESRFFHASAIEILYCRVTC